MQQESVEGVVGTVGWSGQHKRLPKQLTTVCIVCWLLFPARSTHTVRAFHKRNQGAAVISALPTHGQNFSQAQPRGSCRYVDYQNILLDLFLCTVTQPLSFPARHTQVQPFTSTSSHLLHDGSHTVTAFLSPAKKQLSSPSRLPGCHRFPPSKEAQRSPSPSRLTGCQRFPPSKEAQILPPDHHTVWTFLNAVMEQMSCLAKSISPYRFL